MSSNGKAAGGAIPDGEAGELRQIFANKDLVAAGGEAIPRGAVVADYRLRSPLTLEQVANGIRIGSCSTTRPAAEKKG